MVRCGLTPEQTGAGFTVLAYTDRYVALRGYSDSSDEEGRVPVVTAATAIDLEDGTTIILIMNEVLWFGSFPIHDSIQSQPGSVCWTSG